MSPNKYKIFRKIKYNIILYFLVFFILIIGFYLWNGFGKIPNEVWPDLAGKGSYSQLISQSVTQYKQQGISYKNYLQNYEPFGDYLNYGEMKSWVTRGLVKLDDQGIPLVKYGKEFYYNPVTVSQYALSQHGKYLSNQNTLNYFFKALDRLISMQDEAGAFRYPFSWRYYLTGEVYQPGWVSGMAQGQALSALARGYKLTGNEEYFKAGDKALQFLVKPVKEGGVMDTLEDLHPSLKNYIIFEEYLAEPASYTLNGFMFTLLGLYDWWQISPQQRVGSHQLAKSYFEEGIKTLKQILPYYDIGGFTAYDLGYITHNKKEPHIGVAYHNVHIYLLHALHSITGDPWLSYCERVWASYVDENNRQQDESDN